jgi:2',3'-cyclic-nucleotide 2'-phosphodiesterase (5'-nucleotidase family)
LGGAGYDLLIRINRFINGGRRLFGLFPVSFAARVKNGVKGAVKYISDFEDTAIQLAIEQEYDYVICGHIHRPQIRKIEGKNGKTVTYMNSGDWVEHLTSLEFNNGNWSIYNYDETEFEVSSRLQVRDTETTLFTLRREEVIPEQTGVAAFDAI